MKLSPPLRKEEDRVSLVEGLKEQTIDVIVSDHKPEDEEQKRLTFAQAATGASGIETLLSLSLELFHNGSLKLETIIRALTSNPAKILKLNKGKLSIELVVEKGIGYRPAVMVKSDDQDVDHISIDASFSPVIRVNYSVDSVRVGEELGHDCLIIDVFVDGSISPDKAVKQSAGLLKEMLYIFNEINQKPEVSVSEVAQSDQKVDNSVLDMSVSDIELSARSSNCLKRAGIETVGALVSKDISELFEIKNFGKKSADEINGKLSQYNLILKEDI